jgi:hypothetical protein
MRDEVGNHANQDRKLVAATVAHLGNVSLTVRHTKEGDRLDVLKGVSLCSDHSCSRVKAWDQLKQVTMVSRSLVYQVQGLTSISIIYYPEKGDRLYHDVSERVGVSWGVAYSPLQERL